MPNTQLPADSLTQDMQDEEQYWSYAESAEDTVLQENRQTPPRRSTPITSASEEITDHEPITPASSASEKITDRDFTAYFQSNPLEAIDTLLLFVDLNLVSKVEATTWLFRCLIKTRGELRECIHTALLDLQEPETILNVALSEYDKYGNAERLALAASLLGTLGARAFPTLRVLARSGRAECDVFIHVIAHLPDVSISDRLAALTDLLNNPHADVRYSLPEALRTFPVHDVLPLLQTLLHDEDEDVADEARACLETLGA